MNLYSHENGRYQSTNRDIVYGKQITLFPLDTNVRYTYFFFSVSIVKKKIERFVGGCIERKSAHRMRTMQYVVSVQ